MLRLDRLTLARGANRLLEGASLTVHPGQKIGIVGANGCGKSSLFALLRGELLAEGGDVSMPPRWTIAHVAQETPAVATAAIEFVMDGDRELRAVEQELARAERDHAADGHAIAELHHRLDAIGGYAARARAATLLAGLGFAPARHADPVASFSGGWRMRLNLAQALMARSDLLLLDEPTNHLDLDAVHVARGVARALPGHAAAHHARPRLPRPRRRRHRPLRRPAAQELRGATTAASSANARNSSPCSRRPSRSSSATIAHLKAFVDRFRAKATKAKQAQSRLKALERMEVIAAAHVDSPFSFAFAPARVAARQLVRSRRRRRSATATRRRCSSGST